MMSSSDQDQMCLSRKRRQGFHVVQCLAIVLILYFVAAWAGCGDQLLTRQLWMDEVHSWLLITDPNQSHALSALADGVDFNPPAWFLVTRWLCISPESASELQIRLISLFWTIVSLAGLCILLAHHFDRSVVCAALLLTMSQPLLVHHSTEVRFYGFWSTCCIWVCVILQWQPKSQPTQIVRCVLLSLLSFVVSTTHYFGVLSIGLILLPILWKRWSGWAFELSSLVTGTLTGLVCCLQYLPGQKAALTRPTWISPTTLSDTIGFLQSLLPAWQLIVCLLALLCSRLAIQPRREAAEPSQDRAEPSSGDLHRLMPLLSLSLMPIVIAAVSWSLQPSLVTRYAMVGLPPFAVIAAYLLQRCGQRAQLVVLGTATVGLWLTVDHRVNEWSTEEMHRFQLVERIRSLRHPDIVLFEDRIQWMPVLHHFPELRNSCFLADFEEHELVQDSSLRIVQRDVGRRIQKWYPMYHMKSVNSVNDDTEYYVIPYEGRGSTDLRYAGSHTVKECFQGIFRRSLTRADKPGKHGVSKIRKERF